MFESRKKSQTASLARSKKTSTRKRNLQIFGPEVPHWVLLSFSKSYMNTLNRDLYLFFSLDGRYLILSPLRSRSFLLSRKTLLRHLRFFTQYQGGYVGWLVQDTKVCRSQRELSFTLVIYPLTVKFISPSTDKKYESQRDLCCHAPTKVSLKYCLWCYNLFS